MCMRTSIAVRSLFTLYRARSSSAAACSRSCSTYQPRTIYRSYRGGGKTFTHWTLLRSGPGQLSKSLGDKRILIRERTARIRSREAASRSRRLITGLLHPSVGKNHRIYELLIMDAHSVRSRNATMACGSCWAWCLGLRFGPDG